MSKFLPLHRVLFIIAFIGLSAGALMSIKDTQPQPISQPVVAPSFSPYKNFIAGSGIIEAQTDNIKIGSLLTGVVDEVFVDVGHHVQKGDKLFRLDARQVLADIDIKKTQLMEAQANLRHAKTTFQDAKDKFDLVKNIENNGSISKEEYIIRRNNLMIADTNLKISEAVVKTNEAHLKASRLNLELLTITSPMECIILQVNVHPGEFVANDLNPLVLIAGGTKYHIRVDIDENDAWRFKEKTDAIAYLRGNNELKIPLHFEYLEPYVVPKRNLTGGSSERVDVRVLQPLYSFDPKLIQTYIGQQVDVYIEVP
ncbi:MAG: efflux RND transporter periplasmic adaptor subunit [Alphaproteobacteria bacterium]|nr:efflux RND transporter periplasmic adaptor subunit [Alphaproteobacteria bacterium]